MKIKLRRVFREEKEKIKQQKRSTITTIFGTYEESIKSIIGREAETNYIHEQIVNFVTYGSGNILYISGVPGSGKTHTVLYTIHNNCYSGLVVSYINCSELKYKRQIYKFILESYKKHCGITKTSNSLCELRKHTMSNCKNRHLVIIDEVDFLMDKKDVLIYNLFELPHLLQSNIMLILLSNTLGKLSGRIESRIGKNRLEFKPYNSKEIEQILELNGNKNSLVNKFIAKKVAGGTGDFRKAKDLIEYNPTSVKEANNVIKDYYSSIINRFYQELNHYQQIIIKILKNTLDNQKIDVLNLFNEFKSYCKINNTTELSFFDFTDVCEDLNDMGFIEFKGKHISRKYMTEELDI